MKLFQVPYRNHAFIQNDRQGPLLLQRGQSAQIVGRHRLLQNIHPRLAQFGRHRQRRVGVIAAIAVGPQEAVGRAPPHFPGQRQIELRVRRNLNIEVAVAPFAPLRHQRLDLFDGFDVDRPTQRNALQRFAPPQLGQALARRLPRQIVQGQVQPRLRNRHPRRKRCRDRLIQNAMRALDIRRALANQRRAQIIAQRRGGRFQRLVAPCRYRHALSPSEDSVLARDLDENRWPLGLGEKFEVRRHRIVDGKNFHRPDRCRLLCQRQRRRQPECTHKHSPRHTSISYPSVG